MLLNLSKGSEDLDGFFYTASGKKELIESNPSLLKMTRAVAKAEEFIKNDKEGAREILKKSFSEIDGEVFDLAFENNYPAFATSPIITQEGYEMNEKFEGIKVPFDDIVNNEFAEKVQ
jgi:NitT/TauT family transport system substrate-binding protein